MNRKIMQLAGSTAVALMLGAAPALGASLNDWNTNDEVGLDQNEFEAGLDQTGAFDEWDVNDDDNIDEDEFSEVGVDAEFSEWDANGDGLLDDDEFATGTFDYYDEDESEVIEEPEFGDLNDDMGDEGFWDV